MYANTFGYTLVTNLWSGMSRTTPPTSSVLHILDNPSKPPQDYDELYGEYTKLAQHQLDTIILRKLHLRLSMNEDFVRIHAKNVHSRVHIAFTALRLVQIMIGCAPG